MINWEWNMESYANWWFVVIYFSWKCTIELELILTLLSKIASIRWMMMSFALKYRNHSIDICMIIFCLNLDFEQCNRSMRLCFHWTREKIIKTQQHANTRNFWMIYWIECRWKMALILKWIWRHTSVYLLNTI